MADKLPLSKIKLSLKIQKYIRKMQVTEASDDLFEAIYQQLLSDNPTFIESDQTALKSVISEVTVNFLSNGEKEKETPVTSRDPSDVSLNQLMVNNNQKAKLKRIQELNEAEAASEKTTDRKKRPKIVLEGTSPSTTSTISSGSTFLTQRPETRFENLAGLGQVISQIEKLVQYPLNYSDVFNHLGVFSPSGILLTGPSGCGKTTLAHAIAGETGLPFFKANGPELVGGTTGESESKIRSLFDSAISAAPSIVFIDSLDVISAKSDSNSRGMDRRVVAQFIDSIDAISNLSSVTTSSPITSNVQFTTTATDDIKEEKMDEITEAIINENIPEELQTPSEEPDKKKFVILIAAVSKPENLDIRVRSRFAREIILPIPDLDARKEILKFLTSKMKISPDINYGELARITPGYVGSDLQLLVKEAGMVAVCRIVENDEVKKLLSTGGEISSILFNNEDDQVKDSQNEMNMEQIQAKSLLFSKMYIEMTDFEKASKSIQPSAKREGFATPPDVTWSDVGALSEVREELKFNVIDPINNPERFKALGLDVPAGVLFYGPPGCGKTLLAKALANQSGANFISVKGPEIMNKYVGESESKVRQIFARARSSSPCVIFFDEFDALCPKRGSGFDDGGNNGVSDRIVNQFLTELDGLESRKDVYIIAATNRLELIDDAMLRPGRLGTLLYVPLPSDDDRESILKALTRKISIDLYDEKSNPEGIRFEDVAKDKRTEGFSGADLSALVRESALAVIKELNNSTNKEDSASDYCIKKRHVDAALAKVRPSVNPTDRKRFDTVHKLLKSGLSPIEALKKAHDLSKR